MATISIAKVMRPVMSVEHKPVVLRPILSRSGDDSVVATHKEVCVHQEWKDLNIARGLAAVSCVTGRRDRYGYSKFGSLYTLVAVGLSVRSQHAPRPVVAVVFHRPKIGEDGEIRIGQESNFLVKDLWLPSGIQNSLSFDAVGDELFSEAMRCFCRLIDVAGLVREVDAFGQMGDIEDANHLISTQPPSPTYYVKFAKGQLPEPDFNPQAQRLVLTALAPDAPDLGLAVVTAGGVGKVAEVRKGLVTFENGRQLELPKGVNIRPWIRAGTEVEDPATIVADACPRLEYDDWKHLCDTIGRERADAVGRQVATAMDIHYEVSSVRRIEFCTPAQVKASMGVIEKLVEADDQPRVVRIEDVSWRSGPVRADLLEVQEMSRERLRTIVR